MLSPLSDASDIEDREEQDEEEVGGRGAVTGAAAAEGFFFFGLGMTPVLHLDFRVLLWRFLFRAGDRDRERGSKGTNRTFLLENNFIYLFI